MILDGSTIFYIFKLWNLKNAKKFFLKFVTNEGGGEIWLENDRRDLYSHL